MLRILRALGNIRMKTLAAATIILAGSAILVSPYTPLRNIYAQSVGPGGVPGKSSGGAVSSVFGRTGAVAAGSGDYTAAQVTNAAATNAANTFSAAQDFSAGLSVGASSAMSILYNPSFQQYLDISSGTSTSTWLANLSGSGVQVPTGACYLWGGSSNSKGDNALCRIGFGIVNLGTSTTPNGDGWLQLAAIGNGVSGNTDLRGHITLSSGAGSYTFAKTYTTAPTCVATDTTTAAPIKVTVTTTALTLTGTGSDILNYICAD